MRPVQGLLQPHFLIFFKGLFKIYEIFQRQFSLICFDNKYFLGNSTLSRDILHKKSKLTNSEN